MAGIVVLADIVENIIRPDAFVIEMWNLLIGIFKYYKTVGGN